jgi:hypothetical protein
MATAPGTGYRFLPTPYGTNSSYPHKLSYSWEQPYSVPRDKCYDGTSNYGLTATSQRPVTKP